MNLTLEVELFSDSCFAGSGGGRVGTVDTDIDTGPDGGPESALPLVRGRILKGLLVEELAQILPLIEPANRGPWRERAARLFGTPHQAEGGVASFGDAQLPADLRAAVAAHRPYHRRGWPRAEVLAALTVVRHQTRIDPDTGAPERRSLRGTRLLRAGLTLRAPIRVSGSLDSADRALLAASAAAVRRAGLHRNHGWGEVRLRLRDADGQDLTASWLKGLRINPPEPSRAASGTEPSGADTGIASPPDRGAQVLGYRLTLTAPAVLAEVGGDTTTVETRPYIGGGTVLGALAWRWLRAHPQCADPTADPQFSRLFLGGVRWLNAYPEGAGGRRCLPCPRSLALPKGESRGAYDQASPRFARLAEERPKVQWKGVDRSFVALDQEEGDDDPEPRVRLTWRHPRLTPRLHHTRDREAGRPTEGDIFSYIALDAGERFIGHVLCETPGDSETIRDLLEAGPLPLGRARTAGYGGWAEVEMLPSPAPQTWSEAPRRTLTDEEEENGRLVVTLLSDYLGVSAQGLADPRALEAELHQALGIAGSPTACYLGTRLVTGYVSHWGMPRPSHPAVCAGSVLVFEGVQPDPARIAALCWAGIGTRRHEGFGRVAVHWHGAFEVEVSKDEIRRTEPGHTQPAGPPSQALERLRATLLFNAVRRALIHRAVADADLVSRPPAPSLVGRLRAWVRTASGPQDIDNFIAQASARAPDAGLKQAGRALVGARLRGKTLFDWLRDWLQEGDDRNPLPAWLRDADIKDVCARLDLPLDLLDETARWRLLQSHLDTFCERLRRRAQTARDKAPEATR